MLNIERPIGHQYDTPCISRDQNLLIKGCIISTLEKMYYEIED